MPAYTKRKTKFHLHLTNSHHATAHGGQVLVDALCRRFGLWKRIHDEPALEHRKRTGAGFSPVSNVAQLLFTLTSGGASLADAERLAQDRVLMELLGLDKGADQTTLGESLRAATPETVRALHRLNAEFVDWARQQAKPGRMPATWSKTSMKNTLMIILCGAVIFAAGCSTLPKSDSASLQGTWNGREIGATPETPRRLVFAGNQFDYRGANADDWGKGTFTLQADTRPKQLLLTLTECGPTQYIGKTCCMIYKLEDGTLTAAANEPGNPVAPPNFDSPGARHMVFKKE